MKRKRGLCLGSFAGMQRNVEKFKNNHYTRLLWLHRCWSSFPKTSLDIFYSDIRLQVTLFTDTEIHKQNQVVNAFCFFKKRWKKEVGVGSRKWKKAIVHVLMFFRLLYDANQYPLIEFEQRLRLLLMISTGYLNVQQSMLNINFVQIAPKMFFFFSFPR